MIWLWSIKVGPDAFIFKFSMPEMDTPPGGWKKVRPKFEPCAPGIDAALGALSLRLAFLEPGRDPWPAVDAPVADEF